MRFGKKAQDTMTPLRKLILFLIIFVLLAIFFVGVITTFKRTEDKELCMLSVMGKFAQSTAKLSESKIALQCYTQTVIIKDDGIYRIGSDRKERRIDSLSKEGFHEVSNTEGYMDTISGAIVGEMHDCWEQFFQGKLNLFGAGFLKWSSKNRCMICSEIIFERSWLEKNQDVKIDITEYLNKPQNEKVKDFFGGDFNSNGNPLLLDPTRKNVVMFKAVEAAKLGPILGGTLSACIGIPFSTRYVTTKVTQKLGEEAVKKATTTVLGKLASKTVGVVGSPLFGCAVGITIGYASGEIAGTGYKGALVVGPVEQELGDCDKFY
ncbi:hypothetical protein JW707_04065 [Candidatus Woesearchaeota archaeon]|nr:hypothetical protein [Candidatus Woesearchaeota archaeon]